MHNTEMLDNAGECVHEATRFYEAGNTFAAYAQIAHARLLLAAADQRRAKEGPFDKDVADIRIRLANARRPTVGGRRDAAEE